MAPRILRSRGTPSKFVLYAFKDMYAKFGAFMRFVTIFVSFDANQDWTKCLKNLKVIKKPSMVTLTSLVFATVQFSFESKYQSNFLSIFLHLVHHLQPG